MISCSSKKKKTPSHASPARFSSGAAVSVCPIALKSTVEPQPPSQEEQTEAMESRNRDVSNELEHDGKTLLKQTFTHSKHRPCQTLFSTRLENEASLLRQGFSQPFQEKSKDYVNNAQIKKATSGPCMFHKSQIGCRCEELLRGSV